MEDKEKKEINRGLYKGVNVPVKVLDGIIITGIAAITLLIVVFTII